MQVLRQVKGVNQQPTQGGLPWAKPSRNMDKFMIAEIIVQVMEERLNMKELNSGCDGTKKGKIM